MMESTVLLNSLKYVPNWMYGCLLGLLFCTHYFKNVVRVPTLLCSNGLLRKFLNTHVPVVREKFWPASWCFESRLQTIMASVFRTVLFPSISYNREILKMSDGGVVALDWLEDGCRTDSPIVIILPGITGCSSSDYVRVLVKSINKEKMRVVVFNNRGLGGVTLKTSRLYCAADFKDLIEVLNHIKSKNPNVQIGAIGISMGGLILGNYLASAGALAEKMLVSAVFLSVPWDTFKGTQSIEKPFLNLLLNKYLTRGLCQNVTRIKEFLSHEFWDYNNVMQSRTIREFDSRFTALQFGFKHVDDYYASATLVNKLHLIKIPVLCLAAADDPFQPYEALPVEDVKNSSNVAMLITARGGHIGFMEGIFPIFCQPYIGRLSAQFFHAIFNYGIESVK